ncbi:MAG: hypothetical protein GXO28_00880 [Methanopyri archaeon]|nr:hypothetical protein [Methanopyri archaeon]
MRKCVRCGLPETHARIGPDGLCTTCRRTPPPDHRAMKRRVERALRNAERVLLALSGGLDSLAALALTVRHVDEVVAVTVDTGSLHPEAWRRCALARRVTEVEWTVAGDTDNFVRLFRDRLRRNLSPCGPCSRMIRRRLRKLARETDADLIVTGHELPHGDRVLMPGDPPILRAMCGRTERERRELVREELGIDVPKLAGYTSNCVVLPFATALHPDPYGPELERLAAMARYGYIDPEDVTRIAEPPTPDLLRRLLGEAGPWLPPELKRTLEEVLNRLTSGSDPGPGNGEPRTSEPSSDASRGRSKAAG